MADARAAPGGGGGSSMCQVPEGGEAVFFGVGEPAAGSEAGRGGEGGALVEMGTGRDVGRPAVLWLLDGGPGGGGCWGRSWTRMDRCRAAAGR